MYDIVFLGGGPAGYVGAIRASQLGKKVCVIEKSELGGTCLNRGCIPTKALYRQAEVVRLIKEADGFGINAELGDLKVEALQEKKQDIVEGLVKGIHQLFKKHHIDLIKGSGELMDAKTIKVTTEEDVQEIKGQHIIVGTGSHPVIPPIEGLEECPYSTTEELLAFDRIPSHLIIVGGGVIGIEFACIMKSFGAEVTVVEMMKNILPFVDDAISKRYKTMLKKQGIQVLTATSVKKVETLVGNEVLVHVEDKKGIKELRGDKILLSTGRRPNVDNLGLETVGIQLDAKGIQVNNSYETTISGIYAVGDVNGENMLAHAASYQAIQVVEHIAEGKEVKPSPIPSCIFSFPEIATVGLTEKEAKEQGEEVEIGQFRFAANGKALTLGEGEGFVKIVAQATTKKILGVHILGPHASDLIHEGVLAVEKGLTAVDFKSVVHGHPTLGEAFHEAVMDVLGEMIHG